MIRPIRANATITECKIAVILFIDNSNVMQIIAWLFHDRSRYDVETSPPLIETHLVLVRGLSTKKFLPKCVNEKSSTERRS